MTVVSYRLYCQEDGCTNDEVVRERDLDNTLWKVLSLHWHEGICPACNDAVDVDENSEYARDKEEVPFERLAAIGDAGASNLREKGIVTRHDVRKASDEEILDTDWVGQKGLKSIRQEVQG